METADVDLINHSASYTRYTGEYVNDSSNFIDKILSDNNVVFVNALGNKTSVNTFVPSISLGLNVISVGSLKRDLSTSTFNTLDIKNEYEDVVSFPTTMAPGEGLYGFSFQNNAIKDDDTNLDNVLLNGTSFSAPIVSGIIALLMEEFPYLKTECNAVKTIIQLAKKSNIVDYQLARFCAKNTTSGTILAIQNPGDIIYNNTVTLGANESIEANINLLFNGVDNQTGTYIPADRINNYSKLKVSILLGDSILAEYISTKSNLSFYYDNLSFFPMNITIQISIYENGTSTKNEKFSITFYKDTKLSYTITAHNFYLDQIPSFTFSTPFTNISNSFLIFYNYKNQILFSKNIVSSLRNCSITADEWRQLISLRGREFYCYLKIILGDGSIYFSPLHIFQEPKEFNFLSNINPSDFNFPDAYNNEPINSTITVDEIDININRLRCGYIQEQYINLSSKKIGTGEAYFEMIFDRKIYYCSFGVTLWRDNELNALAGDTAAIEVLDSNGNWEEFIDLLNDIYLPQNRKDILRMEVTNIYGLRFRISSTTFYDRNKGRLCIDNISFTDNSLFSNNYCLSYEPIVERESFES